MADTKISGLTAITTPAAADELLIIDDPGGTALSRKITVTNLLATVNIVDDTTPQLGGNLDANSSDITGLGHVGFLATQDASGGANDLDDYEEGTFTPTILDSSLSAAESQTYSTQVGSYIKIGNRVWFDLQMDVSSFGTLTTTEPARIGGLPFTMVNNSNRRAPMTCTATSMAIAQQDTITGYTLENSANMLLVLWDVTTGIGNMLLSEFTSDGGIRVAGNYQVV